MANTENLDLGEVHIDLVLNENWQKIDSTVVNKNGTIPFIAEQIGVDPVSEQGLTTKKYVDERLIKLGETETTAYRGDRGKVAYDHSQTSGNPHGTTKSDIGLGNVPNVDTTTTINIADSLDKRFITDAEKLKLNNILGVNTGDETKESIETKLGEDFTNLVKRDGTVPFIAEQEGITPTLPNSLATKLYVDNVQKLSYRIPDYSQKTTITPALMLSGYTPPKEGIIQFDYCYLSVAGWIYLKINGQQVATGLAHNSYTVPLNSSYLADSSTTFLLSGNYWGSVYFIPFKS